MRIEYHRTLIADTVRNEAFFAALTRAIVPGKTVVADIGAGSGLLGLMASKLGAKEVFLFETAEVAGVAAKVLKRNRVRNCHLIPCHSTEFDGRVGADVIVSETLGNYALEENIVDTLKDACRRFLKPGGRVMPRAIAQYVAPVVSPRFDDELKAWQRVGHGLDFEIAEAMSRNNVYVRALAAGDLLDGGRGAVVWDRLHLNADTKSTRKGDAAWTMRAGHTIYGFALWWTAELDDTTSLSTAPDAPRTHWEQLYFPLLEPIAAKAGERISVTLHSKSSERAGTHLAWSAAHLNAKGREVSRQALDLDKGYLP